MTYQKVLVKKPRWNFTDYIITQRFVRDQGISSKEEWVEFCKQGKKPNNIPRTIERVYKNKGFKDWYDFTGVTQKELFMRKFPTFENAKEILKPLNLKSQDQYHAWWKNFGKENKLPKFPSMFYSEEYKGIRDWLGLDEKYVSFTEAKKIIKKLNFTCRREYWNYKNKEKYKIPITPNEVYKKEWKSWGDYLGNGYVSTTMRKNGYYWSFKKSMKFVRKLKLKSQRHWEEWCRNNKRPKKLPMSLSKVFEKEWKGWSHFLGNGNERLRIKKLSFKEASKWARKLNLKSVTEWYNYTKTHKIPDNIPKDPYDTYNYKRIFKNGVNKRIVSEEWKGWDKFLGCEIFDTNNKHLLLRSFKEARKYARKLNLTSSIQWVEHSHTKKFPKDLPVAPYNSYRDKWINWADFLGNRMPTDFMSFDEARKYARSLHVKTIKEIITLKNDGKIKDSFPISFYNKYSQDDRWISVIDFLGVSERNSKNRDWMTYQEAKKFIKDLKFSSQLKYTQWCKDLKNPINLPASPQRIYQKDWKGWGDYLSNGNPIPIRTPPYKGEYWSFEKARMFVRKLGLKSQNDWEEFMKSGKKPDQIPRYPNNVYSKPIIVRSKK